MVHVWTILCGVVSTLLCALLLSLWRTIHQHNPSRRATWTPSPTHTKEGSTKVCIVLGSGGHTSEMFSLLSAIPPSTWNHIRPVYLVGHTDTHSAQCAERFEQSRAAASAGARYRIRRLPRPREVGQSYLTSMYTTLYTLGAALAMMYEEAPDVLLLNGPGICVPVVWACYALSVCLPWCGRAARPTRIAAAPEAQGGTIIDSSSRRRQRAQRAQRRRPCVIYIESFTCVHHLSWTGRLLVPWLADVTIVSWPDLYRVAKALQPRGCVCGVYGTARRLAACDTEQGEYDNEENEGNESSSQWEWYSGDAHVPVHDGDVSRANQSSHEGEDALSVRPEAIVSECSDETAKDVPAQESCHRYAVVTVGSTRFDALVRAVVLPEMCALLHRRFGIRHIYVQYGTMPYTLESMSASASLVAETNTSQPIHESYVDGASSWCSSSSGSGSVCVVGDRGDGETARSMPVSGRAESILSGGEANGVQCCRCGPVTVTAFAYRPDLSSLMQSAALVITHAGAGTILECLKARRRLVVVPNRALMSDHQLQLAQALDEGHYLFCVAVEDVRRAMERLNFADQRVYPVHDTAQCMARVLLPWLDLSN